MCGSRRRSSRRRSRRSSAAISKPFLVGWSGRVDPDGNLYSFIVSGAPLNDGRYANAEVDRLMNQTRTVTNADQRRQAYEQAVKHHAARAADHLRLSQQADRCAHGTAQRLPGGARRPDPAAGVRLEAEDRRGGGKP